MRSTTDRAVLGYVNGTSGTLNPAAQPFFSISLDGSAAASLLSILQRCTETHHVNWFTITATHENPARLRVVQTPSAPQFELNAAPTYLRGEVFRISGRASCNIDFSGPTGAMLLAERLQEAIQRMRDSLVIRVPTVKRNIIEFIPDVDMIEHAEMTKLAQAGESLAGLVWEPNEFADWEEADA